MANVITGPSSWLVDFVSEGGLGCGGISGVGDATVVGVGRTRAESAFLDVVGGVVLR